ncbi:MAG: biopolymer transporter ExbD [Myxococcota bacterium]
MMRNLRRRRRPTAEVDLDVTTFMNLMVVLVPFLLITAVFSRITIVELTLPSASGGSAQTEPAFRLEVIVRDSGIELSNGEALIASLPTVGGAYDLARLGEMVMALKREYPEARDASVLLEPQIEYDHLIQVMDVVRSAPLPAGSLAVPRANAAPAEEGVTRVALFTDISIGDAP